MIKPDNDGANGRARRSVVWRVPMPECDVVVGFEWTQDALPEANDRNISNASDVTSIALEFHAEPPFRMCITGPGGGVLSPDDRSWHSS